MVFCLFIRYPYYNRPPNTTCPLLPLNVQSTSIFTISKLCRYFESLGYEWIHHDFNLFGGNRLGKFPKAEAIFRTYFGEERFEKGRGFYPSFHPFVQLEEPDLMVYKPDYSEIRFVECKRRDTYDKLREKQVRGLALVNLLFDCPVEIIEIIEEGKGEVGEGEPFIWRF